MNRILTSAAMTAAALVAVPAPGAHATSGWWPDEVIVTALPAGFWTDDEREAADALDLEPGDVLPVTYAWEKEGCAYSGCPGVDGVEIPIDSPLFAPHGADAENGSSQYPEYGTLGDFVPANTFSLIDVFADDPRTSAEPGPPLPEGVFWVSDQQVTDTWGATWVRIGWGTQDAWIREGDVTLNPVEPDVDEPSPVVADEASESPLAAAEPDETNGAQPHAGPSGADDASGFGMSPGIALGVLLLAGAGVLGWLASRRTRGDDPGWAETDTRERAF